MLNMSFDQSVVINTQDIEWVQSPRQGVWRKRLAREEAERGHATSIVRYEPGASFSAHDHPLGEEILVLEGVFSDETGDYSAGTYFRNPEGFRHAPFSKEGCVLLVKLHQFVSEDTKHVCVDTLNSQVEEIPLQLLHQFQSESVSLHKLAAGQELIAPENYFRPQKKTKGQEIYIIKGELQNDSGSYSSGTWMRHPIASKYLAAEDSFVWMKVGHL